MQIQELVNYITKVIVKEGSFENLPFERGLVINHFDKSFIPDVKMDFQKESTGKTLKLDKKASQSDISETKRIVRELKAGKKIQNIVNYTYVKGKKISLNKWTLSPGPDVDTVIDCCLEILGNKKKAKVIDLCSGCGVIGLLITDKKRDSFVYSLDIDKKALSMVHINKKKLGLKNVRILESNLFNNLKNKNIKADLIVANPPFCKSGEIQKLPKWLKVYSPLIAIDGGEDGLSFYKKIISDSKRFLKADGNLVLQHDERQAKALKKILTENGYKNVHHVKNIFEKNTIAVCRRSS